MMTSMLHKICSKFYILPYFHVWDDTCLVNYCKGRYGKNYESGIELTPCYVPVDGT